MFIDNHRVQLTSAKWKENYFFRGSYTAEWCLYFHAAEIFPFRLLKPSLTPLRKLFLQRTGRGICCTFECLYLHQRFPTKKMNKMLYAMNYCASRRVSAENLHEMIHYPEFTIMSLDCMWLFIFHLRYEFLIEQNKTGPFSDNLNAFAQINILDNKTREPGSSHRH